MGMGIGEILMVTGAYSLMARGSPREVGSWKRLIAALQIQWPTTRFKELAEVGSLVRSRLRATGTGPTA